MFSEYHPDVGNYFGDKFSRLKDAKAWTEKETVKGLIEIVKQLKELGRCQRSC